MFIILSDISVGQQKDIEHKKICDELQKQDEEAPCFQWHWPEECSRAVNVALHSLPSLIITKSGHKRQIHTSRMRACVSRLTSCSLHLALCCMCRHSSLSCSVCFPFCQRECILSTRRFVVLQRQSSKRRATTLTRFYFLYDNRREN